MNCMKCGREIYGENVFCQDCLTEMEKYPVLPDTVVLLPRRRESLIVKKNPKRHVLTVDEQINLLRKWVLILLFLLIVCITAIALMLKPVLHYAMDEHFEIGQNYSSVIPNATQTVQPSAE